MVWKPIDSRLELIICREHSRRGCDEHDGDDNGDLDVLRDSLHKQPLGTSPLKAGILRESGGGSIKGGTPYVNIG